MKLREFFTTEASLALGKLGARVGDDVAKASDDIAKAGTTTQSVGQRIGTKIAADAKVQAKTKEKETDQEVAIIFGRFNPPHVGHKEAWIKASESPVWYLGTNQATVGPSDPLPYEVKVECIKTIWSGTEGHIVPEQTWWTLATYVYKKHGPATLIVVTDEQDAKVFVPGLQKSNGVQGPHGFYNFKKIEWRKADRISSATDLRAAVLEGNRKKFTQAAGVSSETPVMGEPFFDVVAKYLLPYKDQILASMARKAAKAVKKNEDAAGVGIITKQNTTVDVDASTPYKNLKAFGLVKETLDEIEQAMMAEAKQAKISNRQSQSSRGISIYSDAEKANSDYVAFKLGQAMASTDGKTVPDIDAKSWSGKKKTVHPYTEVENEMFKKAAKAGGASYTDLNNGDMESKELDSTNTVSPIPTRKTNQYGV